MRTAEQDVALRSVRPEHDNLRAARSRAEGVDPVTSLRISASAPLDAHRERLALLTAQVADVPGVRIIGTAEQKSSIVSFVMEGVHPHDLGTIVDSEGVAIRTGHHCAMPLMKRYGVAATARASFALYNTVEEVDTLVAALWKAKEVFAR